MTKEANERLGILENKVDNVEKKLDQYFLESRDFHDTLMAKIEKELVSQKEFAPVQKIVYGLVALILTTVFLALLAFVVTSNPQIIK